MSENLIDFAAPEQLEELRRLRDAKEAAERDVQRMYERASKLEREATAAKQRAGIARAKHQEAVIEAAMEDAPAPAASPEANADATAAGTLHTVAELRRRAEAKQNEADEFHGRLRAAVLDLASSCAQDAGREYLEAARRVGRLHAAIYGAQQVMGAAGRLPIVVDHVWESLLIPNSEGIRALANVGTVQGAPQLRLPVVGDGGAVRRAANAAAEVFKSAIRHEVGSWPMERK